MKIRTSSSWKAKLQANGIETLKERRILVEEYEESLLKSFIVGRCRRQVQYHDAQDKHLPLFSLPVHVFLISNSKFSTASSHTYLGRGCGLADSLLLLSLHSLHIPPLSNSARATAQITSSARVADSAAACLICLLLLVEPFLRQACQLYNSKISSGRAAVSEADCRSRTGPL
jgi:hypothetical protein